MAGQDEIRRLMKEAKQKSVSSTNSTASSRTKAAPAEPKTVSKVAPSQTQKPSIPAGFYDDTVADAKARKVDVKELVEKQLDADWAAFQDFADEVEHQTAKEEEEKVEETKEREAVEKLENMEYMDRYRLALERAATLRKGKDKRKLQESTDTDAEDIKAAVKQIKKQKRPTKQLQDSEGDEGFDPCNWRSRGI
ncbi:hypothetical protein PHYBOEH_000207 [Phytophthora boehmeriae]|uniref:ZNF380 coiled-coil domain-containing protein n=1 Tax=Phytophthora boehmeriae TaxID=109152 RepID=A0A8T1VCG3_9STRA|nr:hypothetical protein PHYBOEH_000207 [Phytophthora boehmeriae]